MKCRLHQNYSLRLEKTKQKVKETYLIDYCKCIDIFPLIHVSVFQTINILLYYCHKILWTLEIFEQARIEVLKDYQT